MRFFTFAFAALSAFYATASAQILTTTAPKLRNAVLEEFTGVRCGYCPDGQKVAAGIHDKFPDRTVLISIHSGPFAAPTTGYPDYTTQFGEVIDQNASVAGYPAATINRKLFNGASTLSLGRDKWVAAAAEIRAMLSPVNIGLKSDFDPTSRILTVQVETYYTDDSPSPENYVNVALLENNVIGYQSDYANGNRNDYSHKHMLRWLLSGQWGQKIEKTAKGSSNIQTFTYTVPTGFAVANCDIAAFVSEKEKSDIYTGEVVPADGGTTQPIVGLSPETLTFATGKADAAQTFEFKTHNFYDKEQTMRVSITTDAPADWKISGLAGKTGNVEFTPEKPAVFSMEASGIYDAHLSIKPGATAAVARITITFESVSMPNARKKQITHYVISGVRDLLVSHDDAVKFDSKYLSGLATTGKTGIAATTQNIYAQLSENSLLDGVKNLYFNVSWSFPGLTDDLVAELSRAMDNGMNVMFAGQDLGWDIASLDASSNGTPVQREFYTKYLHAKFIADGTKDNASVSAVGNDAIYGAIPSFSVLDAYGTGSNLYPELMEPNADGRAIFIYNNDNSKVGAVRAETAQYKMAYFGFGMEQINNTETAQRILKLTSDWFDGIISGVEYENSLQTVAVWPNPTRSSITLSAPDNCVSASIINSEGKIIASYPIVNKTVIGTNEFPSGTYRVIFINANGTIIGKTQFVTTK